MSFGKEFCLCLNETQFISLSVVLDVVINLPLLPLSDSSSLIIYMCISVLDSVTILEIIKPGSVATGNGTNVAI